MKKILALAISGIMILNNNLIFAQKSPISTKKSLATLDNIEVKDGLNPQENKVLLYLSQKAEYGIKEDKGKLIIILKDTGINFSQRMLPVAGPLIKQVRSAQHQDKPNKIVWVVIDLAEDKVKHNLSWEGEQIAITLNQAESEESAGEKEEALITPVPAVVPASPESSVSPIEPVTEKAPVVKKAVKKTKPAKAVLPVPAKKKEKVEETAPKKSPGILLDTQLVTLDFNEADIQDVLRVLAIKSDTNIIYGEDVKGTVTIHLADVPLNEALKIILDLKGLVAQQVSKNVVRVISTEQLTKERAQAVTFTKVYTLSYGKASTIKAQLDAIRSAEGRKGNISIDERTNSLVITDTPEGLDFSERLIKELDVKPQQVLIEANIVEITHSDMLQLGVDWSYARTIDKSEGGGTNVIGIGKTKTHTTPEFGTGEGAQATARSVVGAAAGGTGVSAPASVVGNIALGIITSHSLLEATLSALVNKSKARLVSKPRIVTINNKAAKIHVGDSVPYKTTTIGTGGAVATETIVFVDVGVVLDVTPTININKKITLELKPQVSTFQLTPSAPAPIISRREAETTVMVNNGETIVIGGLITDDDRNAVSKVPFLGDLPVLGNLFRNTSDSKTRSELLVFITPTIVEE